MGGAQLSVVTELSVAHDSPWAVGCLCGHVFQVYAISVREHRHKLLKGSSKYMF